MDTESLNSAYESLPHTTAAFNLDAPGQSAEVLFSALHFLTRHVPHSKCMHMTSGAVLSGDRPAALPRCKGQVCAEWYPGCGASARWPHQQALQGRRYSPVVTFIYTRSGNTRCCADTLTRASIRHISKFNLASDPGGKLR